MNIFRLAFSILLCVTILSVGASVVCAVIAGNTAESFRDYRSSVITVLSSLHNQLSSSKQAFADALNYLDGASDTEQTTEPATETIPESQSTQEEPRQDSTDAMQNDRPASTQDAMQAAMYTVREVNGRIGVFDANGTQVRTLRVAVATLPRADREQLAIGITLTSEQELQALIEDYAG